MSGPRLPGGWLCRFRDSTAANDAYAARALRGEIEYSPLGLDIFDLDLDSESVGDSKAADQALFPPGPKASLTEVDGLMHHIDPAAQAAGPIVPFRDTPLSPDGEEQAYSCIHPLSPNKANP